MNQVILSTYDFDQCMRELGQKWIKENATAEWLLKYDKSEWIKANKSVKWIKDNMTDEWIKKNMATDWIVKNIPKTRIKDFGVQWVIDNLGVNFAKLNVPPLLIREQLTNEDILRWFDIQFITENFPECLGIVSDDPIYLLEKHGYKYIMKKHEPEWIETNFTPEIIKSKFPLSFQLSLSDKWITNNIPIDVIQKNKPIKWIVQNISNEKIIETFSSEWISKHMPAPWIFEFRDTDWIIKYMPDKWIKSNATMEWKLKNIDPDRLIDVCNMNDILGSFTKDWLTYPRFKDWLKENATINFLKQYYSNEEIIQNFFT